MDNNSRVVEHNFCRICGSPLYHDSLFCSKCGTQVYPTMSSDANETQTGKSVMETAEPVPVQTTAEPTQAIPAMSPAYAALNAAEWSTPTMTVDTVPVETDKKRKIKPIFFVIAACVLVAAAMAAAVLYWYSFRVEPQDINAINGCPELYNVQFAMTMEEVSGLVEVEHEAVLPGEGALALPDAILRIEEDAEYEIYGRPVKEVACSFYGEYLIFVLLKFSDEDMDTDTVVKLYENIYGEPNGELDENAQTHIAAWEGTKTCIDIFDDEDEDITVVRYSMPENSRYTALSFDGSPIDPCGFADEDVLDDWSANTYLNGLVEDLDYTVYEGKGYVRYTLYPQFEYMGIRSGRTAVTMYLDEGESEFASMQYDFLVDPGDAVKIIKQLESAVYEQYGTYDYCNFTSTNLTGTLMVDLSYFEFLTGIGSGKQGIYNLQWETDDLRVTLTLMVGPSGESYFGSLSFAD